MLSHRVDRLLSDWRTGLVVVPLATVVLHVGGEVQFGGGTDAGSPVFFLISALFAAGMWGTGFAAGLATRLVRAPRRAGIGAVWMGNFFALLAAGMGLTQVLVALVDR